MGTERQDILDAKSYYSSEEAVGHYAEHGGLFPKELAAFEFIPNHARILDLGCGVGRTTRPLLDKGGPLFALDVAHAMVRAAKETMPQVPFLAANACSLCFRDDEFDVVVFAGNGLDCIYPIEARRKAMEEIRRVLKPGGLFLFSAHNHCLPRRREAVGPFLKSLFRKGRSTYMVEHRGPTARVMMYLTTPASQIRQLEELGFELVTFIPRRILRRVRSLGLIGLIDTWVFYVCRLPDSSLGARDS